MTTIFTDGFESGNFNAWTGTNTTNGTVTVSTSRVHDLTHALQGVVSSDGGWAVAYKDIANATTVYWQGYVWIDSQSIPNGSIAKFLEILNSWNPVARFGIKNNGGTLNWALSYGDGTGNETFVTLAETVSLQTWYCIEVAANANSTTGWTQLWVNGVSKINNTSKNTGSSINRIDAGVCDYIATAYIDSGIAADAYISPTFNLTISAVTPTGGGTTTPVADTYSKTAGIYQNVSASANSGYTFDHWMLDSSNVGDSNPYNVLMDNNHTIQAVFTSGSQTITGVSAPLQLSEGIISIPNGNLNGTSNQISVSGGTGAVIGSGVTLSLPQNIHTGASPTFAGLTVNGIMNSNASGSYPSPGSNAGMILDCYTPTHQDGLGIQSGGIWLKYDNNFNIYNDNGSTILTAVALNTNGDMTIAGAYKSNVSSSAPSPHSNAGLKIDLWPAAHSDGIGMQNGGVWLKYGGQFDIYYDGGTAPLTNSLHLDNSGSMTLSGSLTANTIKLPSQVTPQTPAWIFNHGWIWHYTDGIWDPSGMPIESTNNLMKLEHNLIDPNTNEPYFADWTLAMIDNQRIDRPYSAVMYTHAAIMVQRDLSVGGFVASDQGALALGHGLQYQMDPPKIWLFDSNTALSDNIVYLPDAPANPKDLQLFICNTDQNPNYTLYHIYGYQHDASIWHDLGPMSDYQSRHFDTLYISQFNTGSQYSPETPGHLDLGNLTAHGEVYIGDSIAEDKCLTVGFNKNDKISYMQIYGDSPYTGLSIANGGTVYVGHGIYPSTNDDQSCGNTNYHWDYVYCNHLRYDIDYSSFDALDDLQLVKNYKIRTVTEDGVELQVIDKSSLQHLLDKDGFYSSEATNGFLLGCIKALVNRIETLEKHLTLKL
jgi:hypothetical protein